VTYNEHEFTCLTSGKAHQRRAGHYRPRKLHSREGIPKPRLEAYHDPTVRATRHPESWGQVQKALGLPL